MPLPDGAADMCSTFSVFTHLLHEETFLYLEDMKRVLRPGGRIVFSFLEFHVPAHWHVFDGTLSALRKKEQAPLNTFIERGAIACWARHLGLEVIEVVDGPEAPWG